MANCIACDANTMIINILNGRSRYTANPDRNIDSAKYRPICASILFLNILWSCGVIDEYILDIIPSAAYIIPMFFADIPMSANRLLR